MALFLIAMGLLWLGTRGNKLPPIRVAPLRYIVQEVNTGETERVYANLRAVIPANIRILLLPRWQGAARPPMDVPVTLLPPIPNAPYCLSVLSSDSGILPIGEVNRLAPSAIRFHEWVSIHKDINRPFPLALTNQYIDWANARGIPVFWDEWDFDALPQCAYILRRANEGYLMFSTNSSVAPLSGFVAASNLMPSWGASIQSWYFDTRRLPGGMMDGDESEMVAQTRAAQLLGANVIQYEPYEYFFNPDGTFRHSGVFG